MTGRSAATISQDAFRERQALWCHCEKKKKTWKAREERAHTCVTWFLQEWPRAGRGASEGGHPVSVNCVVSDSIYDVSLVVLSLFPHCFGCDISLFMFSLKTSALLEEKTLTARAAFLDVWRVTKRQKIDMCERCEWERVERRYMWDTRRNMLGTWGERSIHRGN